jgi:ABC-type glycerol-3-phosphate transport system substrate-binding protein
MNRCIMLLLLCTMILSPLAAGGQQEAANGDDITLKVASWSIQEKGTGPYLESLGAAYEAKYPGRTIEWIPYPYGQLKQQVLIMAAAGEAPDVIQSER